MFLSENSAFFEVDLLLFFFRDGSWWQIHVGYSVFTTKISLNLAKSPYFLPRTAPCSFFVAHSEQKQLKIKSERKGVHFCTRSHVYSTEFWPNPVDATVDCDATLTAADALPSKFASSWTTTSCTGSFAVMMRCGFYIIYLSGCASQLLLS